MTFCEREREREREMGRSAVGHFVYHAATEHTRHTHTLVPLSKHISERIETDRSTSGMSQPGLLVLRTSAAI